MFVPFSTREQRHRRIRKRGKSQLVVIERAESTITKTYSSICDARDGLGETFFHAGPPFIGLASCP